MSIRCCRRRSNVSRPRGPNTLVYAFTAVPEGTESDDYVDAENQRRRQGPSVSSEPGYYDHENVWRPGLPTRHFLFSLPGNRRAYANVSVSSFFTRRGSSSSSRAAEATQQQQQQQRLESDSIRSQTAASDEVRAFPTTQRLN